MVVRRVFWTVLAGSLLLAFTGCQGMSQWLPSRWRSNAAPKPAAVTPSPALSSEQKAEVQIALGRSLEQEGDTPEAIKVYKAIIANDKRRFFRKSPTLAEANYRLALLYDKRGDYAESAQYFTAALKLRPRDPELLCDLGYSCYAQHRWADAEIHYREALAVDPEMRRAHNNLGMLLARVGQHDAARNEFLLAGCSEAQSHTNHAYACLLNEQWLDAQMHFELALAAEPNLDSAKQGLATLQNVQAQAPLPSNGTELVASRPTAELSTGASSVR